MSSDPSAVMSPEVFSQVMSHLPPETLADAALVSKSWSETVADDYTWRRMAEKRGIELLVSPGVNVKEMCVFVEENLHLTKLSAFDMNSLTLLRSSQAHGVLGSSLVFAVLPNSPQPMDTRQTKYVITAWRLDADEPVPELKVRPPPCLTTSKFFPKGLVEFYDEDTHAWHLVTSIRENIFGDKEMSLEDFLEENNDETTAEAALFWTAELVTALAWYHKNVGQPYGHVTVRDVYVCESHVFLHFAAIPQLHKHEFLPEEKQEGMYSPNIVAGGEPTFADDWYMIGNVIKALHATNPGTDELVALLQSGSDMSSEDMVAAIQSSTFFEGLPCTWDEMETTDYDPPAVALRPRFDDPYLYSRMPVDYFNRLPNNNLALLRQDSLDNFEDFKQRPASPQTLVLRLYAATALGEKDYNDDATTPKAITTPVQSVQGFYQLPAEEGPYFYQQVQQEIDDIDFGEVADD